MKGKRKKINKKEKAEKKREKEEKRERKLKRKLYPARILDGDSFGGSGGASMV